MSFEIREPSVVQLLRPLDVVAYLRANEWGQRLVTPKMSIWGRAVGNEEFEALVPLDTTVRDFTLRMGDVVQAVAAAEQRPQTQVFNDLLTASADVVRIRIDDADSKDGTLPIEFHAQVAQRARDLLLAAACSATEPRSVWAAGKPTRALDQVRKLRVGQSERGSYIITVISHVDPLLEMPANGLLFEPEVPFERQVIHTLATALAALNDAAATAAVSGQYDAFEEAVSQGVSANLCEAVAGMWSEEHQHVVLEFGFKWSPGRPLEGSAPSRVRFTSDRITVIREAARVMKEIGPVSDFPLTGWVVKLVRPPEADSGQATVLTVHEGRPVQMTVTLAGTDYDSAVAAHQGSRLFSCMGTLVREKRTYKLQQPRDVTVMPEESTIPGMY